MYTVTNFKTKKSLKEAVAAGEVVMTYQPGPFGPQDDKSGIEYLEGPHYPAPHSWYAKVMLENGRVVKVLS